MDRKFDFLMQVGVGSVGFSAVNLAMHLHEPWTGIGGMIGGACVIAYAYSRKRPGA